MVLVSAWIAICALLRLATFRLIAGNALFNVVAWTGLAFIIGLRDIYFGTDTAGYVERYLVLAQGSWTEAVDLSFNAETKDPAFYLLAKAFSSVGVSTSVWLMALAVIFCLSVGYAINKYSPEPFLSFVTVIALGLASFATSGLRQTLAISILLWTLQALFNRRLWQFVVIVAIASLFHSAAMVFLIAYPISRRPPGVKQWLVIGGAFAASILVPGWIRGAVAEVAWTEDLAAYALRSVSLNATGFLVALTLLAFCGYYMRPAYRPNSRAVMFYNMATIAVVFHGLAIVIAEFFRFAYFFSISYAILVPMCIQFSTEKKLRPVIYASVLALQLTYFYYVDPFQGLTLSI